MATRAARLHSPSSSISRSRSPISDSEKRSVSTSPRRGPSTPVQSSGKRNNSDDEHELINRELLTLGDDNKAMLGETSSTAMSDVDQNDKKKRTHHRRHNKESKSKSNKRPATHQRHSVKRSKKETVASTHRKKSNDENSRSPSEKKSTESEATKSDQVSSSNLESDDDEEGVIHGNNTPSERRSRRHRKKHRSSPSAREKKSSSSHSSLSPTAKSVKGTQLIVNYLPSALRESDFYQLFARVAPVKLCKLITDRRTGHSFCYGFVEYHTKDDAVKAIEKYNGYKIEHKKLKVSYAQPKLVNHNNEEFCNEKTGNSGQKNPNIYITELPDSYDEKMLERLFSKYGEIAKTKILRDPRTKISRGVGFVLMTSTRYAERAVKALDGYIPSGSRTPISVKYADPSKTASGNVGGNSAPPRLSHSSSISPAIGPYGYPPGMPPIGMMDPYYAAAALHHHQQHHRANVNMRDLSRSPPPHISSYYGDASSRSYSNHTAGSSSSRARTSSPGLPRSYSNATSKHSSNLNTSQTGNVTNPTALSAACELIAKGCQQAIDPNGFVIYAFGLPHDCNENDLEELFRRYGDIYRVYIVRNYATGESKGYSFVTMRNYDEACHAVDRLDGSTFQGRTIQVRFKQ